jgi:hypothetical protein
MRYRASVFPQAKKPVFWPLVGVITGAITATTGVFVMPAVPYLAIGLEKEDLVGALGLSFTSPRSHMRSERQLRLASLSRLPERQLPPLPWRAPVCGAGGRPAKRRWRWATRPTIEASERQDPGVVLGVAVAINEQSITCNGRRTCPVVPERRPGVGQRATPHGVGGRELFHCRGKSALARGLGRNRRAPQVFHRAAPQAGGTDRL